MDRRSFLKGSLALAAATRLSGFPLGRRELVPKAYAGPTGLTPYPVLGLFLRGGHDPAMHLVATPNGPYGTVTIGNRMSGTDGIKETATGIRYFVESVTPQGQTDFEAHLGDVALLRSIKLGGCHGKVAGLWMGTPYGRQSWAANLSSQFRAAGVVVPKPCALAHQTQDYSVEPYLDFLKYAPDSPDPAAAPERILSVGGFFDGISSTGLPKYELQTPAYALAQALDRGTYSAATQPDVTARFSASSANADGVLKRVYGAPSWPPPQNVVDTLGISASGSGPDMTGNPPYEYVMALAYQAFSANLSHVIAGMCGGGGNWDSHANNYNLQISEGQKFWPLLGKFLALMKSTPSPIVDGKTLFDTTNIWIQSEMGRTPGGNDDADADGTGHWEGASVILLGGRFKRGTAIGGFADDWSPMPVNPTTGNAAGGDVPDVNNVIATVIKAAGGNPTSYTSAAPIDALLDMSR